MSFDFENVFINWLAHFIFIRLLDIHKKVMGEPPKMVKTTPPKVQSPKIRKVNQGGAPRTKSPKIRSEHVSQPSRKTNQSRASVAIKQKETSNGKGGIIFLIILGILFGSGYISMKRKRQNGIWHRSSIVLRVDEKLNKMNLGQGKKNVRRKRDKVQTHHLLRLHLMMKEVMMHIQVIMMRIVMITMKVTVMV